MPDNYNDIYGITKANSLINGSATGADVSLGAFALSGLIVPASMAGASITFQVSVDDGTTWYTLKDASGNIVTVTLTGGSTSGFYSLRSLLPMGVGKIRPVSASSETSKTVIFIGQRVI